MLSCLFDCWCFAYSELFVPKMLLVGKLMKIIIYQNKQSLLWIGWWSWNVPALFWAVFIFSFLDLSGEGYRVLTVYTVVHFNSMMCRFVELLLIVMVWKWMARNAIVSYMVWKQMLREDFLDVVKSGFDMNVLNV